MTHRVHSETTQVNLQATRDRRRRLALLRKLVTNPVSLFGLLVVAAVLVCALAAPWLAPHDPTLQDLALRLKPPIWQAGSEPSYLLGTDALGRDMLSRIIFGARISLVVGVASVIIQGGIGLVAGLAAGYYGGHIDNVTMRVADIQQSIPFLILAVAVAAVLEGSLVNIIIVLGITGWVTYGRVVRGQVLSLRQREFIEAARVIGNRNSGIIYHHVLPNIVAPVTVIGTLAVSTMILAEASLSFLGLGVPAPAPTWGGMVADGRDYLVTAWWVSALPGLAIFCTVLGINLFGDWLRETLDPTLN
jgi:peptide/nickel transport system permease protein